MYTVKSDKEFFERFMILELRVRELSCLFQNSFTEASKIEVIEWNTIASKLQCDLSQLIEEANNRFIKFKENTYEN